MGPPPYQFASVADQGAAKDYLRGLTFTEVTCEKKTFPVCASILCEVPGPALTAGKFSFGPNVGRTWRTVNWVVKLLLKESDKRRPLPRGNVEDQVQVFVIGSRRLSDPNIVLGQRISLHPFRQSLNKYMNALNDQ